MNTKISSAVVYVSALVLTLLLGACGKKDDPTPVNVLPPGAVTPGVCATCTPGLQGLVASALGATFSDSLELGLSFYGQGTQNIGLGYFGPVVAEGRLIISQPVAGCQLPIGSFPVRTVQQGNWSGEMFDNLKFQTTAGPGLTFTIRNAMVNSAIPATLDKENRSYPYWMAGDLVFEGIPPAACPYPVISITVKM